MDPIAKRIARRSSPVAAAVADRFYRSVRAGKTRWTQPSLERGHGPRSPFGYGNSYWVVEKPIKVWLPTGRMKPSNTWIGAANMISLEVEETTMKPGDEFHQIPGGLFAVQGMSAVAVSMDQVDIPRSSVREVEQARAVQYRRALGPEKMLREDEAQKPRESPREKFRPELPQIKEYTAGIRRYIAIAKAALPHAVEFADHSGDRLKATPALKKIKKLLEHVPDAPELPPNQRGRQDKDVQAWLEAREEVFIASSMWLQNRASDKAALTTRVLDALRPLWRATRNLTGTAETNEDLIKDLESKA